MRMLNSHPVLIRTSDWNMDSQAGALLTLMRPLQRFTPYGQPLQGYSRNLKSDN
jgi:hypothetical protein